ncbi:hypothetical protein V491_08225 [Pseudogymnoascus sp. VKM F-3775]|nr:hypothetical protein V491_08225 [Pseudogymnoascus sp. VKM F-3775]
MPKRDASCTPGGLTQDGPPPRKRAARQRAPPKLTPPLYKASIKKLAENNISSVNSSTAEVDSAILKRIKSCLDRANHPGTPESEAKTALCMASRFMARYNVSQAEVLAHERANTNDTSDAGSSHSPSQWSTSGFSVVGYGLGDEDSDSDKDGYISDDCTEPDFEVQDRDSDTSWDKEDQNGKSENAGNFVSNTLAASAPHSGLLEPKSPASSLGVAIETAGATANLEVKPENKWASQMQLQLFRETALKIADEYLEECNIKVGKSKRRVNVIRDRDAYNQGVKDSTKIDLDRKRITESGDSDRHLSSLLLDNTPIMGRAVVFPEPFNVLYFPCDISSVAFSFDSHYLAVAGEEGLVVFQENTQLSMFEPIAHDVQKGVNILALQWTASNSIEYLCLGIKDSSLQIHRRNISPRKSKLAKRPAETSFTIDSHWTYSRTPWQSGNKTCRYEFGANGGYFAGVSNRSVEIFMSSSKYKPKHGFMSDLTPKEEIVSNIVRHLNEMQQSGYQDEDSNDSKSMEKDGYLGPDAAQNQHVLNQDREESLPTGLDHTLLASKRDRDDDEERLRTGKKQKRNHTLLESKRDRDDDEDENKDEERLRTGKKHKRDHTLSALERGREEDKTNTMDEEESLNLSKKAQVYDNENQDVEKTPLPNRHEDNDTFSGGGEGDDDFFDDYEDGENIDDNGFEDRKLKSKFEAIFETHPMARQICSLITEDTRFTVNTPAFATRPSLIGLPSIHDKYFPNAEAELLADDELLAAKKQFHVVVTLPSPDPRVPYTAPDGVIPNDDRLPGAE